MSGNREINIYGGLQLENLELQDEHFDLQSRLYQEGLIQGIQLRVAHPVFTPSVTHENLDAVIERLPEGIGVLVHFGAENVGVDLGECFDEKEVYAKHEHTGSWKLWNSSTLCWGLSVLRALRRYQSIHCCRYGVIHPGYIEPEDHLASPKQRQKILEALKFFFSTGYGVVLENVPAYVHQFWGVGGTTFDMRTLLNELGEGWKCLIDFTHLHVTCNQANLLKTKEHLRFCQTLGDVVDEYMGLPHVPICHYSGVPTGLVDEHKGFLEGHEPPGPIREAIGQMETVCLEIPFTDYETSAREIETFREQYL